MRFAIALVALASGCATFLPPPVPQNPVRSVEGRDALVQTDAEPGERLAIRRRALTGDERAPVADRLIAVGTVVSSRDGLARVRLGMNEEAGDEDWAEPTDLEPTADRWVPPRVGDVWVVQGSARGAVVLDEDVGGGVSTDLRLAYHFEIPLVVAVEWSPFVLLEGPFGVLTSHGIASVGVDLREVGFEAGAGLGAGHQPDPSAQLSIRERLRVGSRDGLSLTATCTQTAVPPSLGSDRALGWIVTLDVQAQLPLWGTYGVWLTAGGGGSDDTVISGRAGLRFLLLGQGGGGSLYLAPQLEVLRARRISDRPNADTLWGAGLGLEVEGRL